MLKDAKLETRQKLFEALKGYDTKPEAYSMEDNKYVIFYGDSHAMRAVITDGITAIHVGASMVNHHTIIEQVTIPQLPETVAQMVIKHITLGI